MGGKKEKKVKPQQGAANLERNSLCFVGRARGGNLNSERASAAAAFLHHSQFSVIVREDFKGRPATISCPVFSLSHTHTSK
jgi:hypothetical protein